MNEENIKKVIDRVYSEMLSIVLKDFDSIESEQVEKYYHEYLNNKYYEIIKNNNDQDKITKVVLIMEKSFWNNKSTDYKLSVLIRDEYLEEIGNISQKAFELAKERKSTNEITIDKVEAEQYINRMKELSNKVQHFNVSLAYNYILEGNQDFNYACGNSEEHSLRVGRAL